MYTTDIVGGIVCAAANALQTNFAIFQNIGGKAVIISKIIPKLQQTEPYT